MSFKCFTIWRKFIRRNESDASLVAEEFLEFGQASFIDMVTSDWLLAQVVPFSNVGVLAEIESGNFVRRDSSDEWDVSNSDVISCSEFLAFQEGVQESESFFHLLELLWVSGGLGEDLWVIIIWNDQKISSSRDSWYRFKDSPAKRWYNVPMSK